MTFVHANRATRGGGKKLHYRLIVGILLVAGALSPARAQNICVHHDGREACVVHVMDPNTGTHIWTLWTDNFYQRLELDSLGTALCLDLTEFDHITPSDTTSWHDGGPAVAEYELEYGWTSGQMQSQLWVGSTCADSLEFVDTEVDDGEEGDIPYVQFSARFQHRRQPVELMLFYRAYPDGYLECWGRVTNTSADEESTLYVHHLTSFRRRLAPAGWQSGKTSRWAVEYVAPGEVMKYKTMVPVTGDCQLVTWGNEGGPPPLQSVQWYAVRYDNQSASTWERAEGFVLSYIQPQNWQTATHLEPDTEKSQLLDVRGFNAQRTASTEEDEDENEESRPAFLPFVIPAGMSLETNHAFFMFTNGTIDDATTRTHGFIRKHYVPTPPAEPDSMPRVQYLQSFWEPFSFTYATLMGQAEECQDLGVELFVIDANWWRYSLFNGSDCGGISPFNACRFGTGYWFSDPCRFPEPDSTLADFGDQLATRSMDLGLWVYPSAVDTMLFGMLDSLDCWQAEPPTTDPCFCSDPPGSSCAPWHRAWHTQFQGPGDHWEKCEGTFSECPWQGSDEKRFGELCCAHDSARVWIKAQLDRLLDDDRYGAKYLKFDGATRPCSSTVHTHCMPLTPDDELCRRVQTPLLGFFQMVTEVREDHAGVIYEAPWPTGHVATVADPSGQLGRLPWWSRYSMESMRCYIPPPYTGCFLYEEPDSTGLTGPQKEAIRKHYIRTVMLGPFTISCDVLAWSPPFRDLVIKGIQYYKDNRRFLRGQAYSVLTQRSFCSNPSTACEESWDAVEFLDPDEGDARAFVFRTASPDSTQAIVLRGLDPQEQYAVAGVDHGAFGTYSGATLMSTGIAVTLSYTNSSEILEIVIVP
jgi:hypothetical protein